MIAFTEGIDAKTAGKIYHLSVDDLCTKIKIDKEKYSNSGLYEYIGSTEQYTKLYFDYESYHDEPVTNEQKTKIISSTKYVIATLLFNRDEGLKFAISESIYLTKDEKKDKYKVSFHFIVCNYKILYSELIIIKNLFDTYFKKFNLDTAVYGKTQKFRMIGTSKVDKKSPLLVVENSCIPDHFITNVDAQLLYQQPRDEKYNLIASVLMKLPAIYYDQEAEWTQVAGALKNTVEKYDLDEELVIRIFNLFSKMSDKYSGYDDVIKYYNQSKYDHLDILTLGKKTTIKQSDIKKEFPKIDENDKKQKEDQEYLEIKNKIEKNYFYIKSMSQFGYYDESKSEFIIKCETQVKLDFAIYLKNKFFNQWICDETRRTHNQIIFDPHTNTNEDFNLFTGFELAKKQNTNADTLAIHQLLDHVLGEYKKDARDWPVAPEEPPELPLSLAPAPATGTVRHCRHSPMPAHRFRSHDSAACHGEAAGHEHGCASDVFSLIIRMIPLFIGCLKSPD